MGGVGGGSPARDEVDAGDEAVREDTAWMLSRGDSELVEGHVAPSAVGSPLNLLKSCFELDGLWRVRQLRQQLLNRRANEVRISFAPLISTPGVAQLTARETNRPGNLFFQFWLRGKTFASLMFS